MPWHFAKHAACVLWARPERTFCTRAHRVAASHCRRPALAADTFWPFPTRSRHAPTPPSPQSPPGPLLAPYSATDASRHRRSDSSYRGRRRPSHSRAPARPEQLELIPSPCQTPPAIATSPCSYRTAVRRRSYPRPPREPTLTAYKRDPELNQAPRRPQATPPKPPRPASDGGKPSSPSPASSAAAALRLCSSRASPPPSI